MSRAEKINEHLQQMKGKTFNYANALHHVSMVEVNELEQEFTIRTNKNTIIRKFESFENFIQYWTPAEQVNPVTEVVEADDQSSAVALMVKKENDLADDMIKILRDNIDKVQQNPAYIEQAKAINNNVNSIINIAKLKMAFVKEIKRKK